MKELTITPPEGYEVDKEKSTFEKIVFKPIDTKPRSWKEYVFTSPTREMAKEFLDCFKDLIEEAKILL